MAKDDDTRLMQDLQGLFREKEGLKIFLEQMLRIVMESEVEQHIGATPYERSEKRTGYRSGAKPRTLKTRVGELSFEVPQVRDCAAGPYHPSMFLKWQRSERALLVACAEMYFQGVSTRRVNKVLDVMGGMTLSAGQVSRIAAELDEKLDTFRSRSLAAAPYPFLIIDARYEKVRVNGHVVSQAVLIISGVDHAGYREVFDWRVADSESEATWGELFRDLKDRGLKGVAVVVSDAHKGIRAAMRRHFQGVAWQRCRVHFKRELFKKVSWRRYKELASDISAVFKPEERRECLRRAEEMAVKWEKPYPKVAAMLRDGLEDCLTVCDLPSGIRRKLNSTNMLERVMKELKARTRVVGVFPNRASCERLIGARLPELEEAWKVKEKRYLAMEQLAGPEYSKALRMTDVKRAQDVA